ncbi:hypothetical protein [Ekhidna sp.]
MTKADYIIPIESSSLHYHQFQIFSLPFGLALFLSGLNLIFDDEAQISVNGVLQDGNFFNALPFTIIGLLALIACVYYTLKHSKARISNKGITIKNRQKTFIEWDQIIFVELKKFITTYAIRVHTKDGIYFSIEPDKPVIKWADMFDHRAPYYRTKMWLAFKSKVKVVEA